MFVGEKNEKYPSKTNYYSKSRWLACERRLKSHDQHTMTRTSSERVLSLVGVSALLGQQDATLLQQ